MAATPGGAASARWESQRILATLVQVVVLLVPLAAGFGAANLVAVNVEPLPGFLGTGTWWVLVLGSATLVSHRAERLTRRVTPLPMLLRLTMAFPDRAPSRFRMALATRDTELLRRQLEAATKTGHAGMAQATQVILSLAQSLSKHDRNTRGHSERTGAYADLIAREMGMRQEDRDKLRWAAILHDIGKLEIPAAILNKPGALSPAEFEVVKSHPVAGMAIIEPIREWLGPFADGIGQHHEQWDGSGYPLGLAGTDISLAARIISVADAYDVMTTGRIYQPRVSHAAARREIADKSGSQFDPRVTRALLNLSVGRLRWIGGPISALADPRILRSLELVGRDVATVVAAGAITVAAGTGALGPFGFGRLPSTAPGPTLEAAAASAPANGAASAQPGPSPGPSASVPPGSTSTTAPVVTASSSTTTTRSIVTSTTAPPPTTTASTTTASTTTTTAAPGLLTAQDDAAETKPSDKVNVSVLANDAGVVAGASLTIVTPPQQGVARVLGGGKIQYDAGIFAGIDSFEYQVCNPSGECATAVVTVTVSA